jgi:hypothetical protein
LSSFLVQSATAIIENLGNSASEDEEEGGVVVWRRGRWRWVGV